MSSGPTAFNYEKNNVHDTLVTDQKIFDSHYRLLVFCAVLGYNRKRRVHDFNTNGEMRWEYINQNPILSVMSAALAYAATDDPNAIMDPEIQIETLVQHGAGGSRLLNDRVITEPGNDLDLLVELLQEEKDQDEFSDRVDVISQIEREVSSL